MGMNAHRASSLICALIALPIVSGTASAAIINLSQTVAGNDSKNYSHLYDRALPGQDGYPDANATLSNININDSSGSETFYQINSDTNGAQGSITFDFNVTPLAGHKLVSVSVVTHTHDFGDGNTVGQWDTDLTGSFATYYDSNVTNTNIGTTSNTLSGVGIENATTLQLRYLGTVGGGNSFFQQIFGVHDAGSATQAWTFSVTANYAAVPEPASIAILLVGLVGGLAGMRFRRKKNRKHS